MALDPDEFSRRLLAARMFAGYNEKRGEFSAHLEHTLGKHDIARWERCEPGAPEVTPGKVHALSEFTGLPPEWFTEPDLGKLFASEQASVERLARATAEMFRDPGSSAVDDFLTELESGHDPTSPPAPEEPDEGPDD